MTRLFGRSVLGVLGIVLVGASGVYGQTTGESGQDVVPRPAADVKQPTSTTVDLLFTPVTPCRIIDTRLAGGPIAAGTTRNFVVTGTTSFSDQGGTSGGCGIPAGSPAAVINYVAVGPAGPGDLRVVPAGTPIPTASILNYAPVGNLNIANGVATPLFTGALAFHITVQADVSATDLVADVLGYFREVSCQAGTRKALGQCWEASLRAATTVFAASDTCRAAGGRLAAPLELRSLRGGNPLTLDLAGEWVDGYLGSNMALLMTDDGGLGQASASSNRTFRCVFRPLP